MNMPFEEFESVTCANGHSRRFVQVRNGWMRRLQQDSPGEIDKVSPWMPDETGQGRADGVYCRFCDSDVDFSDHKNSWLSLIDEEDEVDWLKRRFSVPDGVSQPDHYPKIFSNITELLRGVKRDDYCSNMHFVLSCDNEAWDAVDDESPMFFSKERAGDVICTLSYYVMQLAAQVDDATWAQFIKTHLEEVALETAMDCELMEWYDLTDTINAVMDSLEKIERGEFEENVIYLDNIDFDEDAA